MMCIKESENKSKNTKDTTNYFHVLIGYLPHEITAEDIKALLFPLDKLSDG
jgi:hypothetical protein